jgi:ppGpp synthetase/RelA/SpoT-type nucleotidyltranferase
MALTDLQILTLVQRYIRERDRFEKLAATVMRHLTNRLRNGNVKHLPTFRSKDPESLQGKLERDRHEHSYEQFEQELTPALLDLSGVRVLLYERDHVLPVTGVIEEMFNCPADERFRKDHVDPDGYQARHRCVTLPDDVIAADPALTNVDGVFCEVQITTLADHIWSELEHDIEYKKPAGEPSEAQQALLQALRG